MRTFLSLVILVLVGCQAPCLICKTPEPVLASMQGQVENLRIIEKDLVDGIENEDLKQIWKGRLAAFITEARSTSAWAAKEEFDLKSVLDEEQKD